MLLILLNHHQCRWQNGFVRKPLRRRFLTRGILNNKQGNFFRKNSRYTERITISRLNSPADRNRTMNNFVGGSDEVRNDYIPTPRTDSSCDDGMTAGSGEGRERLLSNQPKKTSTHTKRTNNSKTVVRRTRQRDKRQQNARQSTNKIETQQIRHRLPFSVAPQPRRSSS